MCVMIYCRLKRLCLLSTRTRKGENHDLKTEADSERSWLLGKSYMVMRLRLRDEFCLSNCTWVILCYYLSRGFWNWGGGGVYIYHYTFFLFILLLLILV